MSGWIAAENLGAEEVKRRKPVQVVLGNPPYSGESRNKSAWIAQLVEAYKKEPEGGPLKERNSKWINDDYVKFIRFAHDRISRTGHGVVAFITNHGWLDNPTFRGMRASLMRDFDDIYIVDLHGNSKKKENTPSALKAQGDDKNVFDIEQGVSMVFLLKTEPEEAFSLRVSEPTPSYGLSPRKARIHHHELWGGREWKYNWLQTHGFANTPWQKLKPATPLLLLIPRNEDLASEYAKHWKITDAMPVNSVGIVTARDALTIHFSHEEVRHTIDHFAALPVEEARLKFDLGADVRDWRVEWAQKDLKQTGLASANIVPIAYRPFDIRHTYYTGNTKGFHCMPRSEVMGHLVGVPRNIGLSSTRSVETGAFTHAFVVNTLTTHHTVSLKEVNYVMPLWLTQEGHAPYPNFNMKFLMALSKSSLSTLGDVSQEDVLSYIYAVLYSPSYRSRYAEFLKSDFPRIPVNVQPRAKQKFAQVWQELIPLGKALIDLHLLKKTPLALQPGYPQIGSNEVEKPSFEMRNGVGRVWINAAQYFDGVPQATWQFKVGGYQVCEKWLKDRKGRSLSLDDIEHYQKTVAALTRTQELMQEIDAVVDGALWP
jgi:predicted helicase